MSLLIFTSIAARIPPRGRHPDQRRVLVFVGICVFGLAIIASVVFVEQGQRRIPAVRQAHGGPPDVRGTSTYLPLKVNQAGVIRSSSAPRCSICPT